MGNRFLIFDFDGTLADTNEGIVRTFQETFRLMDKSIPSVEAITSTIGRSLRDGFTDAMPELTGEEADKAVAVYREIFPSIAFPLITAFPGIIEMLSELHSNGMRMAIATSRSHHSLEKLAEQIGVIDFFEGMFGAEDVVNHKPAPDLVNLIISKFSLNRDDVLVIGDANFDILMGHAAGCKVCAVSWGNQSAEILRELSPEHLVSTIPELLEVCLERDYTIMSFCENN